MSYHPVPYATANYNELARNNIIRELVETEKKYVQDLELLQKYATALSQSNLLDQGTIDLIFSNVTPLLDFQRKFLIGLEGTLERPWQDQRWGRHFLRAEEGFGVYVPYCANYSSISDVSDLALDNEEFLTVFNHLINFKHELPAFLVKPVSRVYKYPLLIESLIKRSSAATYPHYDELKSGFAAARRVTDTINEAQRLAENARTVNSLRTRVADWKGHHIDTFGDLLLDDILVVTRSNVDQTCHVFFFERIILCCTDAPGVAPAQTNFSGLKRTTPLLLKGRIFLADVMQTEPVATSSGCYWHSLPTHSNQGFTASPSQREAALAVWWNGDDGLEAFTLRFRWDSQRREWEAQIARLIRECAERRAAERNGRRDSVSGRDGSGFDPDEDGVEAPPDTGGKHERESEE
ncbi:Dbl homology domain-containing protein [Mycena vulgaris]|nr:Dbl homology domain-containing protein [Mycena vulgaris]